MRGQAGDQPALVALVVHDRFLVDVRGGVELAALVAVGHGDLQCDLRGGGGGAVQRHPALDQGAEHGEEAAAGGVDGRGVGAVLGDVAVAVEQVGARDADVGEVQPAVVDAVEPALEPVVLAADARQEARRRRGCRRRRRARRGSRRSVMSWAKTTAALPWTPALPRYSFQAARNGRVDDEFLRVRVVGGGGADGGDVGAVPDFRHREGSRGSPGS